MNGIGNANALIQLYIENPPPLEQYQQLARIKPVESNEIAEIAQLTGNHWRKIFNVLAKLVHELERTSFNTWQSLRDMALLQYNSNYCLRFDAPVRHHLSEHNVHIIIGKTYATQLGFADSCYWLTPYFAINEKEQIIICPYFDYRQLSNEKISQLVKLIKPLRNSALRIPAKEIST